DRLSAGNRQGDVLVCPPALGLGYEALPGDRRDRGQDPLVGDRRSEPRGELGGAGHPRRLSSSRLSSVPIWRSMTSFIAIWKSDDTPLVTSGRSRSIASST